MHSTLKTASIAFALVAASVANANMFRLTVTNYGPQPLSPMFFSASDSTFDIFSVGGTSSLGIKNIAESGNTAAMLAIAGAAGSSVASYGKLPGGPMGPGEKKSILFDADVAHGYFSFASMLGKTNDGFIGESVSSLGLKLFYGTQAANFSYDVFGDDAWDAGTEKNTQDAADLAFKGGSGNPAEDAADAHIRVHGGVIPGVGDSFLDMPAWNLDTKLANVRVESVPEPGTLAFVGMAAIGFLRRRGKKQSAQ